MRHRRESRFGKPFLFFFSLDFSPQLLVLQQSSAIYQEYSAASTFGNQDLKRLTRQLFEFTAFMLYPFFEHVSMKKLNVDEITLWQFVRCADRALHSLKM